MIMQEVQTFRDEVRQQARGWEQHASEQMK